jgi:hypothetical protein
MAGKMKKPAVLPPVRQRLSDALQGDNVRRLLHAGNTPRYGAISPSHMTAPRGAAPHPSIDATSAPDMTRLNGE